MLQPTVAYTLVTPPALEPVTLAEAKAQARIDGDVDDAMITSLITAAREHVELVTGRCLITQTWRLALDEWPRQSRRDEWWDGVREGPITLLEAAWVDIAKAPIAGITEVRVLDESGTPTVWASSNYFLARRPNGHGRLTRKSGVVWPIVTLRAAGAIEIDFTVGYGTLAANVPFALRQAIRMLVAHWYDCGCDPSAAGVPKPVAAMLAAHRVMRDR